MNIYFLVEGIRTEMYIYPKWLGYLLPELKRVKNYRDARNNNYFLLSGRGIPSIYNHLAHAADDINNFGYYDYLVLCLDAEELTVKERLAEVEKFILKYEISLKTAELVVIVQNRCIETWFMGNRKIYPEEPKGTIFKEFARFYNVSQKNPEKMKIYQGFSNHARFHASYLNKLLLESNIYYSKRRPGIVAEKSYIDELILRCFNGEGHLDSLKTFFEFCFYIRDQIEKNNDDQLPELSEDNL